MGSDPGSRSPPAAHRPFLGEEGTEAGEKPGPAEPPTDTREASAPPPTAQGSGHALLPRLAYLCTAGGTGRCSCPRHPHRHPRWSRRAPHSHLCSPHRLVLQSQPGRSTCGEWGGQRCSPRGHGQKPVAAGQDHSTKLGFLLWTGAVGVRGEQTGPVLMGPATV